MPVYKNQKRGSWYCSFYYTDWSGARRRKKKEGFRSRREARDYETAFLLRHTLDRDMPFATLTALYLEDCRNRCKPTSLYQKTYLIENKILPYYKKMSVGEIEASTVRRWQNELLSHRDAKGSPYADAYLKSIHVQLSAIFNYGVRYCGLTSNPAALCGTFARRRMAAMDFWTVQEFERFLSCIGRDTTQGIMFQLLFWTGIRSGELLALTAADYDPDRKLLHISRNYCRFHGEDLFLEPKTPKSARPVALPDFLCDSLNGYLRRAPERQNAERLFPVSKYYLAAAMKRGCRLAQVKEIRIHDLRHSHASLLIELGYSPLLIAERLGHEKIETTLQTYSHLYPNKQSDLALQLDAIQRGTLTVR